MAIFYDMIKGAVPIGDNIRYYYIDWVNNSSKNAAPQLYYSSTNCNSKSELVKYATNLGNILCSRVETNALQNLEVYGYLSLIAEDDNPQNHYIQLNTNKLLSYKNNNEDNLLLTTSLVLAADLDSVKTLDKTNINTEVTYSTWIKQSSIQTNELNIIKLWTNNMTLNGTLTGENNSTIQLKSGYIEAPYFNTTSDKRAKDNIELADFSALDLINQLPVYNFTYKNNPTEPTIGLIAQEVLEKQQDLSLVQNAAATGVDNDYMSLKENRLIYVLWKAIQEQQKEIDILKTQLEVIQNGGRN